MTELVVALHELWDRASEIPNVPDCYLVGIWNPEWPEDTEPTFAASNGLYMTPWHAWAVEALGTAWQGESWREDWNETWGHGSDRIRLGCNTLSVRQPVMMRFRWGEGHPQVEGVAPLPHEPADHGTWCRYCGTEISGLVKDCPVRRLAAFADAVECDDHEGEMRHLKAVNLFHRGGS